MGCVICKRQFCKYNLINDNTVECDHLSGTKLEVLVKYDVIFVICAYTHVMLSVHVPPKVIKYPTLIFSGTNAVEPNQYKSKRTNQKVSVVSESQAFYLLRTGKETCFDLCSLFSSKTYEQRTLITSFEVWFPITQA